MILLYNFFTIDFTLLFIWLLHFLNSMSFDYLHNQCRYIGVYDCVVILVHLNAYSSLCTFREKQYEKIVMTYNAFLHYHLSSACDVAV